MMIDGRTDILQYYTKWIENRFNEGFLYIRNPAYPTKVHKFFLDHEHIEAITCTSKDYRPALDFIKKINSEYPCIYNYTITAYGKDIEPGVPSIDESIDTCLELSSIVGPNKVFWRYDPVLLTDKYDLTMHADVFEHIAERLNGKINRCIYSYVKLYEKTKRHMPELKLWTDEMKVNVAKILGNIAKKYNMIVQTCACELDLTEYGVSKSGCLTKEIIKDTLGLVVKDKNPNGSLGCGFCYPIVNIGEYNTCLNKCKYCYASSDFDACERNFAKHNQNSPYLIGNGTHYDEIVEYKNYSVISNELNLWD